MNLIDLASNCTYFHHTSSLNEQLKQIKHRLQAHAPFIDRVSFAFFEPATNELKTYADSETEDALAHYHAPLSELPTLLQAVEKRQVRIISSLEDLPQSKHTQALLSAGYKSSYAQPCFENEEFIGFMFLNSFTKQAFDNALPDTIYPYLNIVQFTVYSELRVVHAIAECAEATQNLSPVYRRDSLAHQERVSHYARIIANGVAHEWNIDDETCEHIALFARFHDIGKVRLNADLICKSDTLAPHEKSEMQSHVKNGIQIIDDILKSFGYPEHPSIELLRNIMSYHHEFLDGSGYPFGLVGEQIPYSARIVAVANIFDALTTHRPYRQAWSVTHALLELEKMARDNKIEESCINALRDEQDELKQIISQFPEHDPKDEMQI